MKTNVEMIAEFWEQDRQYGELVSKWEGNEEALGEADFLYQQGVRVADIAVALEELYGGSGEKGLSAE